eukprot:4943356-Amphidinium_carterae.2
MEETISQAAGPSISRCPNLLIKPSPRILSRTKLNEHEGNRQDIKEENESTKWHNLIGEVPYFQ